MSRGDRMFAIPAGQTQTHRIEKDGFRQSASPGNPVTAAVIPIDDFAGSVLFGHSDTEPIAHCIGKQRKKVTGHERRPDFAGSIGQEFGGLNRR